MAEKQDALELLKRDHRNVEGMFYQYEQAQDPDERTRIAHEVVNELAVHGEIEELRFYPRMREVLPNGDKLADEAISEHLEAKQVLNEIDSMTAHDDGFHERMTQLMADIRHHVEEEETEMLPAIRRQLSAEELADLGEKMESARSMVPTRPHPNAPTSPGAKAAAGPPMALVDRVRDAIRGREEVTR